MSEALTCKANVASVEGLLERLERLQRTVQLQDDNGGELSRLREQMRSKVGTHELGAMLDLKANIEDVNAALAEVSRELERKAPVSALDDLRMAQAPAGTNFSLDSAVGRWIWKSGRTKAGGAVPWNIQSINSDSENLQWEKDRSSILVVVPGLYEVTFGFFSRRKPTVQLLVDGEPVLAAVNSASYSLHQSSGRLTSVGQHSAGSITGLTLIDFLALPPRAKLSVVYNGEDPGEGFLSLKKL
mmetsp:Transcript_2104/g.6253  ORF Transcript_2104/g.6253 Transcript_2104/m.6253 type:complete len:243 (-) Transcript_2104:202-930(-)